MYRVKVETASGDDEEVVGVAKIAVDNDGSSQSSTTAASSVAASNTRDDDPTEYVVDESNLVALPPRRPRREPILPDVSCGWTCASMPRRTGVWTVDEA